MVFGYARCSTNNELQDINRQVLELKKLGVEEVNIYKEYVSGGSSSKVELDRLLSKVGSGDTIVTTEVSRITRSTKQLCDLVELAKDKKLKLVFGSFTCDFTGSNNIMETGMLLMMGVFAELERNIISERVRSGIENARANKIQVGRPALTIDKLPNEFLKFYPMYKTKQMRLKELCNVCGRSKNAIYRYIEVFENSSKSDT